MENLSNHARKRCAQRGVSKRFLSTLIDLADIERPVGDNCRLLKVSRFKAQRHQQRDKLCRYAVIVSDTTTSIVTVLPIHGSKSGKRYGRSR